MRNFIYPRIPLSQLQVMLGVSAVGALLAGVYGILHDQITYCISDEYFTRFKFAQFAYADFGLPSRVFVAEIGFLSTWWVGFFAGWFTARIVIPKVSRPTAVRAVLKAYANVFALAFLAGLVGDILGYLRTLHPDYSDWQEATRAIAVARVDRFVWVAYIHNASYLGGLIGIVTALLYVKWRYKPESVDAGGPATPTRRDILPKQQENSR
jgi:hypothetical protein